SLRCRQIQSGRRRGTAWLQVVTNQIAQRHFHNVVLAVVDLVLHHDAPPMAVPLMALVSLVVAVEGSCYQSVMYRAVRKLALAVGELLHVSLSEAGPDVL